ncbi:uncharacterized protein L3040_005767 [Drepanopeziza brunnea f. sp. 'multigermtubi']|uniref:uncharacterized protein n=1 Tax=Drepanopeziza brunnea f. sp. 'multigermtubi' TaxID=698441 RepID=UPI00238F46E4|nr:hypothetical protein L3040_005767 [Drepanopeziza brunnea f. sp. 'multigermtubi']
MSFFYDLHLGADKKRPPKSYTTLISSRSLYPKPRRSLAELQIPYPFTAGQTSKACGDLTLGFEDMDEVGWSDECRLLGGSARTW